MEKGLTGQQPVLKFAVTGPESTGKSTLAQQLAEEFHTLWVPEYAREYLLKKDGHYTEDELLIIAEGQSQTEKLLEHKADRILFCDTENIVIKIWSLVKYGRCHPEILEMLSKQHYIHYFLCYIDIPWEDDLLREHPHMREELFAMYTDQLNEYHFPFTIIKGNEEERLNTARAVVQKYL